MVRDTKPDQIPAYFEKLRAAIEATEIKVGPRQLNVTASIGVVIGTELSLDEMIKKSDEHLYTAKNNGRNQVVIK